MNKKQLIERIEGLKNLFGNQTEYIEIDAAIELISKLDEPQAGRADETPRYLRNVIERLRELPLHDREVWLKAIMSEFEQDFSHAKWCEGYEVKEEKRYEVILCNGQSLKTVYRQGSDHFDFEMVYETPENFTKKQLEDAGFGWVFDCEGIEVEEVE